MHKLLLFIFAAFVSACGGGGSDETPVPFATIAHTQYSGVTSSEQVVVRGSSELNDLWSRITVNGAPVPSVDFAALQVVGVFLGSRPNGCFDVAITRITQTPDRLVVRYRESTPLPGDSACTQAVVTPAHLVAMARSQLPVEFVAE